MIQLPDTRFTPEYLAEHPADQALASMLGVPEPGPEECRPAPGREGATVGSPRP